MTSRFGLTLLMPLVLLIGGSILFRFTGLDLDISSWFYARTDGFNAPDDNLAGYLYRFGELPALAIGLTGLLTFVGGFGLRPLRRWRKIGAFFFVFLLLGPGLIVNLGFKEYWGRPRPAEVVELGGEKAFYPMWKRGQRGGGYSFPSGHASVAFFLLSPFFVFWGAGRRDWAAFFLVLGLLYGTLMGLSRIAQGGHFVSDVFWSAGVIYLLGIVLYYAFRFDRGVWWPAPKPAARASARADGNRHASLDSGHA